MRDHHTYHRNHPYQRTAARHDGDVGFEVALALAAYYDDCPDPACECRFTDRGQDVYGCPVHDAEEG